MFPVDCTPTYDIRLVASFIYNIVLYRRVVYRVRDVPCTGSANATSSTSRRIFNFFTLSEILSTNGVCSTALSRASASFTKCHCSWPNCQSLSSVLSIRDRQSSLKQRIPIVIIVSGSLPSNSGNKRSILL